jgi:hypothetical protein
MLITRAGINYSSWALVNLIFNQWIKEKVMAPDDSIIHQTLTDNVLVLRLVGQVQLHSCCRLGYRYSTLWNHHFLRRELPGLLVSGLVGQHGLPQHCGRSIFALEVIARAGVLWAGEWNLVLEIRTMRMQGGAEVRSRSTTSRYLLSIPVNHVV